MEFPSVEKNVALTHLSLSGNLLEKIPTFADFDKNIALKVLYVGNNRVELCNYDGCLSVSDLALSYCPRGVVFSCESRCPRMCPNRPDDGWEWGNWMSCEIPCDTSACSPVRDCN